MVKTRLLSGTDLTVSSLCLGTGQYGTGLDSSASKQQLSEFHALGGNFIDTAHVYGNWVEGERSPSEKIIGQWFKEMGLRDEMILTTKGGHPDLAHREIPRLHSHDIAQDIEESLRFLQTNYIDLYLIHRDDPLVPVGDIIDSLDRFVEQGKIRYYGCSNWHLSRILEAEKYAIGKGSRGFVINQLMYGLSDVNYYNLPDKSFVPMDRATHEYHKKTGMCAMAYMSMGKGYFAKKAAGMNVSQLLADLYENRSNRLILEKARKVIEEGLYSCIDLSLMYLMAEQDFPVIPVASFKHSRQLEQGMNSFTKPVPELLLKEFSRIKEYVYWE